MNIEKKLPFRKGRQEKQPRLRILEGGAAGVKKGCCGTLPGSVQPVSGGILWASANP